MIIKITFNDNDYGEILEDIGKYLESFIYNIVPKVDPKTSMRDQFYKYIEENERWQQLVNPNVKYESISNEDRLFMIKIMSEFIDDFINDWTLSKGVEEMREEIINKSVITLDNKFIEENENGENLYIFTRSRNWIVQ